MNTIKQPQTCYVKCTGKQIADAQLIFPPTNDKSVLNGYPIPVKSLLSVYIFTPEELEALLQKERREAAEKAWNESVKMSANKAGMHASSVLYLLNSSNSTSHDKETYLNTYYPKPINTNQ